MSYEIITKSDTLVFYAEFNDELRYEIFEPIDNINKIIFKNQHKGAKKITKSQFNKSVDNLPERLKIICFGYSFNQPVDNLPFMLEWIEFGYSFNQRVDMLPNNIRYLVFGIMFNQPIDDLPTSIEYLMLGENFNQNLNNLPNSIQKLELNFSMAKFTQNTVKLPTDLNEIKINCRSKSTIITYNFVNELNKYVNI